MVCHILDRAAGRHVVFTPLGLDLVDRARTALTSLEAVTEAAMAARSPLDGSASACGVIPTVGPFLLGGLVPVLRGRFPRPWLYFAGGATDEADLVDRLASNRLDLLLLATPCDCEWGRVGGGGAGWVR